MQTIKVVREQGYFAMFRALKVVVDGEVVGSVKAGQTIEILVPESAEEMVGEMDWAKTVAISIRNLGKDSVVVFTPYFTFNLLRNIGIMKLPIRVAFR